MISYSALIILILVRCCPAYETTSPPRGNGRKTTHISEFTDPKTGLNPFLDLEEGGADEVGRDIVDEEHVLPRPLSDSDLQLIEGDPVDRERPQWNEDFGRRWGSFNDKPQYMIPMSPSSDVTSTERQAGNTKYETFSISTESNLQVSSDVLMVSTRNSDFDESDYNSHSPVEIHNSDADYNTGFQEVEAETEVTEENTQPKKVSFPKYVLISVAITGASVAVIALLLAICRWRQKMKCVSTGGNASIADNNIESIISEKVNKNDGIQIKSLSA